MTWTNVAKPTGANWTQVHVPGKHTYDDTEVLYDDPNIFYDGVDELAWTMVAKPTGGQQIFAGYATGMITPPTYSRSYGADPWTRVSKPS